MTLTLVKGIDPFSLFQQLLPLASTLFFYGSLSYLALTTKAGENTARLQSQSSWKAIVTTKAAILFIYGIEALILMGAKWTAGISSSEPRTIFICGSALSWTVLVSGVRKTPGSVAAQYRVIWLAYTLGESLLLSELFFVRTSDDWSSLFHITAHILKLLLLLTLCLVYKDSTCSSHRVHMDDKQRPIPPKDPTEQNTVLPRIKKMLQLSMKYQWPNGKPWLKVKLIQIVLITGLDTALNIIVPQQLGHMSDKLNTSNGAVWAVFVYMMLKFLHREVIDMIRSSIWLPYQRACEEALLVDVYNHIMHLSMDFHEEKIDFYNVEGVVYIVQFARLMFLEVLPNILCLLSTAASLISDFGNDMGLIIAAVLLMLTLFSDDKESPLYEERNTARSEKYYHVEYSLRNWVYVDQFDRIDTEVNRFAELVNRKHTLENMMGHSSKIRQLKRSLIFMAGSLAACFNVTSVREDGKLSGNILRLIAYWEGLSGSIFFFDNNFKRIKNHAMEMATFLKLFERKPTITNKKDARPLAISKGVVEFQDVSFRKLKGVSFKCGGGQIVGCVGLNGAGKSTMMMLLARLYDPESGSIEIDEQDIKSVTTASLRDQIYLLTQESPKMGKTIRENLRYCVPEVTDERICEAAFEVGLYDLDKKDEKLSGGELQKLALARAILRNPKIFLLDEPTSALDNTAQESFRHTLMKIASGRTAFIVAHRMQTIVHADLILVFEEGQIVQQGTHKELVGVDGLYRKLWDAEHFGEMREK